MLTWLVFVGPIAVIIVAALVVSWTWRVVRFWLAVRGW